MLPANAIIYLDTKVIISGPEQAHFTKQKGGITMSNIKYEIKESIGVLSENGRGWTKELNLVSWNDRAAKYDLRDWDETHEKMGKGITLTGDELIKLRDILNSIEI